MILFDQGEPRRLSQVLAQAQNVETPNFGVFPEAGTTGKRNHAGIHDLCRFATGFQALARELRLSVLVASHVVSRVGTSHVRISVARPEATAVQVKAEMAAGMRSLLDELDD